MTNTDMDVEQIETNINREFSNTNKTQTQTQNLQTQTTQNQNQKETNNEKTFSTPKNLLNSTSLNLAQNKEEEFQLLINELKSNNMQIGEQEKKLVKKAHIKFLEEMELLKTDRDERLQEIQNCKAL
ncbi:hypothetical protein M0813_28351 [Anaeramoeba flamelloides]|uniref:Uncharacterized protein n=1 Tax=Anaeramoeba flamelloides TaxID=1746091 RepID=A0ABQ8XT61_9EUKA|nr:hypothetical protein M0813_28351 [Anaeramoeba flamelloides]